MIDRDTAGYDEIEPTGLNPAQRMVNTFRPSADTDLRAVGRDYRPRAAGDPAPPGGGLSLATEPRSGTRGPSRAPPTTAAGENGGLNPHRAITQRGIAWREIRPVLGVTVGQTDWRRTIAA